MAPAWFPVGPGLRATTRKPYRWTVERITPRTGRFHLVGHGVEPSPERAQSAALRSAGVQT
jgi:hypothetical protein